MPTLKELYEAKRMGRAIVTPQDLAPVTGILDTMEFQPASHGLYDIVEVNDTLPVGSFRRINGGLPVASMTKDGVRIDLFPFGAVYEADAAIVDDYPGGLQAYTKDKTAQFTPGLAKSYENRIVYGDGPGFAGLRQIAKENGHCYPVNAAGTGNDYTSIIAVKWDPALCTGLYSKEQFKKGIFVPKILNGGKVLWVNEFDADGKATGKKKPVYQWAIEQPFGLKVIGKTQVACLTGIKDADGYRPSDSQMNMILDIINADPGTSRLYLMRGSRTMLKVMKGSKMTYNNDDTNLSKSPTRWDDIAMTLTTGITNTEARVA